MIQIREQAEAFEAAHAKLKNDYTVFKNKAEQKQADIEEALANFKKDHANLQASGKQLLAEHAALKAAYAAVKIATGFPRRKPNVIRMGDGPIAGTTGVPGVPRIIR